MASAARGAPGRMRGAFGVPPGGGARDVPRFLCPGGGMTMVASQFIGWNGKVKRAGMRAVWYKLLWSA